MRESRVRTRGKILSGKDGKEEIAEPISKKSKLKSKKRRLPSPESDDDDDDYEAGDEDHIRQPKAPKHIHVPTAEELAAVESVEPEDTPIQAPKAKAHTKTETSIGSTTAPKTKTASISTSSGNQHGAWTKREEAICMQEMNRVKSVGRRLRNNGTWDAISQGMVARGCNRSSQAIKNTWNRHLRAICGIDERLKARPDLLTTGLLTKKNPESFRTVKTVWPAHEVQLLLSQVDTLHGISGVEEPRSTTNSNTTQVTGSEAGPGTEAGQSNNAKAKEGAAN